MSNWMNEAGEPYMTHAQLAFEAALDEQDAIERAENHFYEDWGYEEDDVDPEDCEHGDASHSRKTDIWTCDICGTVIDDLEFIDGDWWPRYAG